MTLDIIATKIQLMCTTGRKPAIGKNAGKKCRKVPHCHYFKQLYTYKRPLDLVTDGNVIIIQLKDTCKGT